MATAPCRPAPLALIAAALLAAGPVASQTMRTSAPPAGGVLAPGPGGAGRLALDVRAAVPSEVPGCPGFVDPSAPDAVVDWTSGDLRVWARAPFDATLLVAGPEGGWTCNDDAEGFSPVVEVGGAAAGRYAVWVGAFEPDPEAPAALLFAGAPSPVVLETSGPAAAGDVEVEGGFEAGRGPVEITVPAGGLDWGGSVAFAGGRDEDYECTTYIDAARPTVRVRYGGGVGPLVVSASAADAAVDLVVRRPDGTVACSSDNDAYFAPYPTIPLDDAAPGDYAVWVGTARPALAPVDATLLLSETAPEAERTEDGLTYSEGEYTVLDLSPPAARLETDGTPVEAAYSVRPASPNPVRGPACVGHVEPTPTVALRMGGAGPVAVTATAAAAADLVLLLRTPGGAWLCSDDAAGTDPGVQIATPEGGDYLVWVGTFAAATDPVEVTLSAGPGEVRAGADGVGPFDADPQSEGVYSGDEIRPGGAAVLVSQVETEVEVPAGGSVLNPVVGPACAGFLSERPAAEVTATEPVTISASGDTDLTLVARTAGGAWVCSDDAEGTDPRVEVESPGGAVSVWVGTFSRSPEPRPARLRIER